ncbi:UNVERIFIED_CONTAM: hypothetical protein PYX00_004251 [Menopon gallinae]|uniref:phosphoglucomutase (alpha-D-glucose-1,6-bisphosphate-dependent) n=1 Tax=Menopon gallinae TaxID=328185 RepID=A0AAW2I3I8_9NEOP
MSLTVRRVETKSFEGQKPGTSGLRKTVKTFQQEHYTENFVQSILTALGDRAENSVLVVGGDGRYFAREAISIIIQIAAANKVSKLIIGQNGILSTPAVSCIIRKYKTDGGIVLTASHNPGGPNHDFGIKFNTANGGPAPESVTNQIYKITTEIKEYLTVPDLNVDISKIGVQKFRIGDRDFTVEVIDSVQDYLDLMKSIFDFEKLSSLIKGNETRKPFKLLINSMHGVTGPYVRRIFVEELGATEDSVINTIPLEDFGGHHPDPNLTYAADLVQALLNGSQDFGAAFDGDGDRNMILGEKAFFVNPSDSLAVLADNLEAIPYFKKTGVRGFARSMPTGSAIDRVASSGNRSFFEVPTGWKRASEPDLTTSGRRTASGQFLAWLSVVQQQGLPVRTIVENHWKKYGRNYFTRYDYEDCQAEPCGKMMKELEALITSPVFAGREETLNGKTYKVQKADNYAYKDPVDGSEAKNQGIRILFEDGSRIIYRLSGTGSSGATVRLYVETYEKEYMKFSLRIHRLF